jgi:hypothetical protein
MGITNNQIKIIVIFLICIGIITILYIKYDSYGNSIYENFQDSKTTDSNKITSFDDSEIPNLIAKNNINNQISTLETIFNKYAILDPAISVNNNGLTCSNWSNYNIDDTTDTSDTSDTTNNCKIVQGSESNDPQCLVNNVLTSCNNFYKDGYINKLSSINIKNMQNIMRNNIIRNSKLLINNINKKNKNIDNILNLLLQQLDLEKQQQYFIKYNKGNIDDKTKLVNNTSQKFEKNENDINVNQINFSNFLEKNKNNDKKINLYYKILIYLIIAIIIIGIFNILVTKM